MDDEFASPIDLSAPSSAPVQVDDGFLSSIPQKDDEGSGAFSIEDDPSPFVPEAAEPQKKEEVFQKQEENEVKQDEPQQEVEQQRQEEEQQVEPPEEKPHEETREEKQDKEEKKEETVLSPKQEEPITNSPSDTPAKHSPQSASTTDTEPPVSLAPAASPPPKRTTKSQSSKPAAAPVVASKAPKWAPDDSSPNCTSPSCKKPFSFFNRRHHCRRCGGLFCSDCCGLTVSLPLDYGYKTRSRVCSVCFHKTLKERITIPSYSTIPDGGPSTQTKAVSSTLKLFYWKMGAYDGAVFDRSIVDTVENSGTPIHVQQVQDLMIDRDNAPTFRLRVYTPEKEGLLPILFWYHTGHFCTRNIESPSVDGLCRLLANHIECIVVSVDYRLAPENKFPAAVNDCYAAVEWAVENANNLRGDPTRLALGGDGAGGNLAAAVALQVRDRGKIPTAHIRCQVIVCAPLDLTANATSKYNSRTLLKDAYVVPASQWKWFVKEYLGQDNGESPYASPILASSHALLPPALVITAGHDPFFSEGEAYAGKLRAAGVEDVIYTTYTNSIHGFFGSGLDESDEAMMEAVLYVTARFK